MRFLIIILTLVTLISCNDNTAKITSQNDSLERLPEPDKYFREKQNDLVISDTVYEEYMSESLKPIRKKLLPFSNLDEWASVEKRKVETTDGHGTAIYYFLDKQLKKITLTENIDSTDRLAEFYLDSTNLFFVFERRIDQRQLKIEPEFYEAIEDSLFFENGELIRIKSNMDCNAPSPEDYRKEEQIRLKTELNMLKK